MCCFKKPTDVYLALGGNIGDTEHIFALCLKEISSLDHVLLKKVSSFHITTPVSSYPQRDYLNACCHIETTLPPWPLFEKLEEIEKKLGKTPKPKNHPRILDIDVLFYGMEKICEKGLIIPHQEWQNRSFVLDPLSEILDWKTFWRDYENAQSC